MSNDFSPVNLEILKKIPPVWLSRHHGVKLRHSTYSYLLTLERYTNPLIFSLRFLRLLLYSLILLIFKPQIALGKLIGIYSYLSQITFFTASEKVDNGT
jgi:hypothetical protein